MQHIVEKVVKQFKKQAYEGRFLFFRSVQYFESRFISKNMPNILHVLSVDGL